MGGKMKNAMLAAMGIIMALSFCAGPAGAVYEIGDNTLIGEGAGTGSSGSNNSYFGYYAGENNSGSSNVFLGSLAGCSSNSGSYNIFIGRSAGSNSNDGNDNIFIGYGAGNQNTAGHSNTIIGSFVGFENNTGSGNVFVGYKAGYSEKLSNKLYIDNCHDGNIHCDKPLIYGEFDNRLVRIDGKLVFPSDERLKKEIEPLRASLDKIKKLKGVSYTRKTEKARAKEREIGLLAQDVEKVLPELVYTDGKGYKSLSYDKLVPVLVEAIKEQASEIKGLKEKLSRFDTLEARLKRLESKDMTAQK
jgi:trimeric autotransporter adhesin